MQRLTIPRTVKQVRSYYRRFIPNFSEVARPLTQLTQKHARFQWDAECQSLFEHLKKALITSPILQHADLTKPYLLHTDASQFAVGAVFTQIFDDGEKVIQCVSKKINDVHKGGTQLNIRPMQSYLQSISYDYLLG